jgi:hypothetical protein
MPQNDANTAKNAGELGIQTAVSPTKPITSDESKPASLSQSARKDPKPYGWLTEWLSEIIGQGVEVAHVFCGTDDAQVAYTIGSHRVELSIGADNFILLEIPNDPMDGAGYRVFSGKA